VAALTPPSALLAEIRALTRDRDRLQQTPQATESQLRAILEAYHPAPARLFSSVDRQIALHFVLDYPTPAAASRIKTTRMNGFLARHHYTGRTSGQVLAERLPENLLAASPGTVAGKAYSAQSFTQLLQLLNTQLAEYDDAIAAAAAASSPSPSSVTVGACGTTARRRGRRCGRATPPPIPAPIAASTADRRRRRRRTLRNAPASSAAAPAMRTAITQGRRFSGASRGACTVGALGDGLGAREGAVGGRSGRCWSEVAASAVTETRGGLTADPSRTRSTFGPVCRASSR
jgi:hypothetical protein